MLGKLIGRVISVCVRVIFILLVLLLLAYGGLELFIHIWRTKALSNAYTEEAVRALALYAAMPFPTKVNNDNDTNYWDWSETPCIFTTNQVQRFEGGSRTTWGNWPQGSEPDCIDFYVSKMHKYDHLRTIPSRCTPVLTFPNMGGNNLSYVVLAAEGANTNVLISSRFSKEVQGYLESTSKLPGYSRLGNFVQGKGLEGVSLELLETKSCNGFSLFRYQAEVKDLPKMEAKLKNNGYIVYLK
ncbi:hypothetical protein [Flexibacterium corallicola]|uniref:hypothetical protein n=1 Tax=Flexibacterium corallicola TaxID=3037259 RepID=UPI00286EC0A8|nr:hypothetical protein [Pseudovibrio sp. M1P-2-3]